MQLRHKKIVFILPSRPHVDPSKTECGGGSQWILDAAASDKSLTEEYCKRLKKREREIDAALRRIARSDKRTSRQAKRSKEWYEKVKDYL